MAEPLFYSKPPFCGYLGDTFEITCKTMLAGGYPHRVAMELTNCVQSWLDTNKIDYQYALVGAVFFKRKEDAAAFESYEVVRL